MRFLATGDLQVHAWRQFSYTMQNGMNSRLFNCLRIFDILLKEAEERGINKVLINGDVIEKNDEINVEVYNAVYRKLRKLHRAGVDTYINLGNHDIFAKLRGRVLHSLLPYEGVARIVEKPTRAWGRLHIVPWMEDPEILKKTLSGLDASRKIGLAIHCGVQGATTGPTSYLIRNPIKLRDVRGHDFGVVLLSDYHTRQSLARNVFYLGSPIQHTFGEIHRPCIWDIELLEVAPWFHAYKIYTDLPRFRSVRVRRLDDFKDQLASLKGDYVRVVLPANSKVLEEDLERLAAGRFQLQVSRRRESTALENGDAVRTLEPDDAIFRYAAFHISKEAELKRLVRLGNKLYRGEA